MLFRTFLILLAALGLVLSAPVLAAADSRAGKDPVVGLWLTEDHDGVIEFYACGTKICGRFHWIGDGDDGQILRDEHNHDVNLQHRPLCQMTFITNFKKEREGNYVDGDIYNPEDGWLYSANMTLIDRNTLSLQGYVLLPILGRSQTWTRVESYPPCKTDSP